MRFSPINIPLLLGLLMAVPSVTASAQIAVGISVRLAPPPLPVYVQPPIPAPGYLWTPGYWGYTDEGGYYWVPGTWVEPPSVGLLWTPAWWGFAGGFYGFHAGYWGPHVGFYGGINYGFGYGGIGFVGGRWDHGAFAYNSAVNNFGGTHITNVYRETVNNTTINRVSFNGGNGGVRAEPTAEQAAYEHEQHVQPTAEQARHFQAAGANPALRASVNHGRPAVAATAKPGEFSGQGVVAARAAGAAHARSTPAAARAGGPKAPATAHARAAAHPAPHPAARPAPHPAQHAAPHAAAPRQPGKEEHH